MARHTPRGLASLGKARSARNAAGRVKDPKAAGRGVEKEKNPAEHGGFDKDFWIEQRPPHWGRAKN